MGDNDRDEMYRRWDAEDDRKFSETQRERESQIRKGWGELSDLDRQIQAARRSGRRNPRLEMRQEARRDVHETISSARSIRGVILNDWFRQIDAIDLMTDTASNQFEQLSESIQSQIASFVSSLKSISAALEAAAERRNSSRVSKARLRKSHSSRRTKLTNPLLERVPLNADLEEIRDQIQACLFLDPLIRLLWIQELAAIDDSHGPMVAARELCGKVDAEAAELQKRAWDIDTEFVSLCILTS